MPFSIPRSYQHVGERLFVEIDGHKEECFGQGDLFSLVYLAFVPLCGVDVQLEYRRVPTSILKAQRPRVHAGTEQHDLGKAAVQRIHESFVKHPCSRQDVFVYAGRKHLAYAPLAQVGDVEQNMGDGRHKDIGQMVRPAEAFILRPGGTRPRKTGVSGRARSLAFNLSFCHF